MRIDYVTFIDRLTYAVISAMAGCLTGALVWSLFAIWLGRYFLSLGNLHFIDAVIWFSAIPSIIGFVAPNTVLALFEFLWGWAWKMVRMGAPPP